MIASAALLLLLAAAPDWVDGTPAASPRAPDWVDGMPAAYPRERFLAAVGAGDDRAAAELRARAGVAAFFESRIASAARVDETEARTRATAGAAAVELRVASISARQEVTAATAKLLEGVEIADVWVDPAGRAHALAILDRAHAVDVLGRRLADVDAEIVSLAGRLAQGEGGRFGRARLAHRIVGASARRPPIVADLRILDPAAEPKSPAGAAGARAAAERALAEVGVAIRATGTAAEPVAAAVTRAVVATGMRAVAAGAPHDLTATVEIESAPDATADAWIVSRLTARVQVTDATARDALVVFVETAKGTSGRSEEATRRAGEALASRVEERLQDELRARLDAR